MKLTLSTLIGEDGLRTAGFDSLIHIHESFPQEDVATLIWNHHKLLLDALLDKKIITSSTYNELLNGINV